MDTASVIGQQRHGRLHLRVLHQQRRQRWLTIRRIKGCDVVQLSIDQILEMQMQLD